jgi:glycine oxidase
VAGSGVLGLATAIALARSGARVTVNDPAPLAQNASGVAAGMLAPVFEAALDPLARPHFDLLAAARDLWPAFAAANGVEIVRAGAVAVGDPAWLEETAGGLEALGAPFGRLSRADLEAAAPGLAPRFQAGLATADDWRVEAPAALATLRRAAAGLGVAFRARAAERREGFDLLVAATGAGRELAGVAPELAGLTPIKGHILRMSGNIGVVVRSQGIYVAPAKDGLAIGASMEAGLEDRRVDAGQVGRLRAAAARLFPALADAPAQAAVGVRGATPDGLPLVGPSAAPGVLVAAGARRNGWLLAPLVAEIVAAFALGRDPGPYAARLAADRFLSPA